MNCQYFIWDTRSITTIFTEVSGASSHRYVWLALIDEREASLAEVVKWIERTGYRYKCVYILRPVLIWHGGVATERSARLDHSAE